MAWRFLFLFFSFFFGDGRAHEKWVYTRIGSFVLDMGVDLFQSALLLAYLCLPYAFGRDRCCF